jgi:hypothetical protein
MPTRIYLVRHGATDLTAEDRFAGSSEVSSRLLRMEFAGSMYVVTVRCNERRDTLFGCFDSPPVSP